MNNNNVVSNTETKPSTEHLMNSISSLSAYAGLPTGGNRKLPEGTNTVTRISTIVEILIIWFTIFSNKNSVNCILLHKFWPFLHNFCLFSQFFSPQFFAKKFKLSKNALVTLGTNSQQYSSPTDGASAAAASMFYSCYPTSSDLAMYGSNSYGSRTLQSSRPKSKNRSNAGKKQAYKKCGGGKKLTFCYWGGGINPKSLVE